MLVILKHSVNKNTLIGLKFWIFMNHVFISMLQANQSGFLEEYQPQTKLPINLWIDDASRVYLSPLIYILGLGEIALKWNGEMIGVRHIR